MKTIVVFACFIAVALSSGLPPSEKAFLKQVHDHCQSNRQTYCDENKLRNLLNNLNDPQVGIHMSCMAIRAGIQSPNGDINAETLRVKLGMVGSPAQVNETMQKCNKKAENPGKTANLLWACIVKSGLEYYHKL